MFKTLFITLPCWIYWISSLCQLQYQLVFKKMPCSINWFLKKCQVKLELLHFDFLIAYSYKIMAEGTKIIVTAYKTRQHININTPPLFACVKF